MEWAGKFYGPNDDLITEEYLSRRIEEEKEKDQSIKWKLVKIAIKMLDCDV